MKKILIFGMSDNLGGVETVIMNYCRNMNKENLQFDFLYNTEKIAYEEEIKNMGGNTFKITPRAKSLKQYKKDMKEFFENHAKEYSAIWVNLCILSNIDWLKYAKKYGIKCRIVHSHNSQNMTNTLKSFLHKLHKMLLTIYATDFWACSEEAGKWFYNAKILNGAKFKIINNAIDIKKYQYNEKVRNEYRKKLNIENKLVIGHIGRFHFQKNHEFLINVFEEIKNENENVQLLLIGQGEDENKIKQIVENKKMQNSVQFLGMRNDIKELLQAMDLFVFPSKFEGLPLVLLEVQANGLDTYASKEGIPKIAKMLKNFEFISLKSTPKEWAEIINSKEHNRKNNEKEIKDSGYDIKEESKKLEQFFIKS